MASIVRHQDQWRAHIYVNGRRESRLFRTKNLARSWAWRREQEIEVSGWRTPAIEILALDALRDLPVVQPASTLSGVYFLWNEDRLVYIGQSRNIARRLGYHTLKPPSPFQRATYLAIPHPWQLAVEQLYIDAYMPQMALVE